eukprot:6178931-Pleurochrysis_carterae.AAC.2
MDKAETAVESGTEAGMKVDQAAAPQMPLLKSQTLEPPQQTLAPADGATATSATTKLESAAPAALEAVCVSEPKVQATVETEAAAPTPARLKRVKQEAAVVSAITVRDSHREAAIPGASVTQAEKLPVALSAASAKADAGGLRPKRNSKLPKRLEPDDEKMGGIDGMFPAKKARRGGH